ncbi:hypothetical protein [Mycolicibacterium sp.]|uniref:hypothetical protein n=1 Tax=Mycolicibacterium sp. TaxID=2320850 RepID=UPI0037C97314
MAHTLQFEAAGVNPDSAIIHDNEGFGVQWQAQNLGPDDAPAFVDRLVITQVESCPGDDSQDNPVHYDSATDADDPSAFEEPELQANTTGPLMVAQVGPFPAGSYRLTVTLDDGGESPATTFNCIEIVES